VGRRVCEGSLTGEERNREREKANSQKLTAKALTLLGEKEGQGQLSFGAMALLVPLKTAWEHSMWMQGNLFCLLQLFSSL